MSVYTLDQLQLSASPMCVKAIFVFVKNKNCTLYHVLWETVILYLLLSFIFSPWKIDMGFVRIYIYSCFSADCSFPSFFSVNYAFLAFVILHYTIHNFWLCHSMSDCFSSLCAFLWSLCVCVFAACIHSCLSTCILINVYWRESCLHANADFTPKHAFNLLAILIFYFPLMSYC